MIIEFFGRWDKTIKGLCLIMIELCRLNRLLFFNSLCNLHLKLNIYFYDLDNLLHGCEQTLFECEIMQENKKLLV